MNMEVKKNSVEENDMGNPFGVQMPFSFVGDEYFNEPVRFKDCDDHYELVYTGEFAEVGKNNAEITRLMQDLKDGIKSKEIHIFINSIGGDVENLSMILQQVLEYDYRITVCCGSAMSAGFILWACGNERYVSPYSELMYHTIYSGYEGKGIELTSYGNHIQRLTERLMDAVGMDSLISREDMRNGASTEVWYLGDDFIKAGKAKNYTDYLKRKAPAARIVLEINGRLFCEGTDKRFYPLKEDVSTSYSYCDLVRMQNQTSEAEEEKKTEASVGKKKSQRAK